MTEETGAAVRVEVECWLTLEDDELSMDDAEAQLRELGNEIIKRDDEQRRFCVMYMRDE